jgi:CRISPR-associated protein Csh1
LKNYLLKYRQNFYDFIYKSDISALKFIDFREMLLDIIIDDISHDEVNKDGYSIYENGIQEKLNLLFSLNQKKETKLDSGEFIALKKELQKSLGYWKDLKDKDGNSVLKENQEPQREFIDGLEHIEGNDRLFAFLCGQLARFLISKRKGKDENKSHADFSYFTEWQTSKLLKEYMWEIHQKYAHELKFYKQYDNAMSMIMTYRDDVNIEDVMEYMIAGYFSNNQLKYQDNNLEEN